MSISVLIRVNVMLVGYFNWLKLSILSTFSCHFATNKVTEPSHRNQGLILIQLIGYVRVLNFLSLYSNAEQSLSEVPLHSGEVILISPWRPS